MCKWTYETNIHNDIWRGDVVDSKEEAIKEGMKEVKEEGRENFKIGIIEEPGYIGIDADRVIEDIQEITYDEYGEVAEDFLDNVTEEDKKELEEKLNEVYIEWLKKNKYEPSFYKIVSEEIITVNQQEDVIRGGK